MRKPDNILYWTGDKPPRQIALVLALQQMSFLGVYLVVSPWFGRILHFESAQSLQLIAATLLGSGIGVMLQAGNRWGIGSGYFIPLQVTSSTFAALTLAKAVGGPGAMFGLVSILGLAQLAFSHLFVRMRAVFTVEVAGVAVLLIGLGLGYSGVRLVLETDSAQVSTLQNVSVCALTLGTMVVCNVWFTGYLRLFSAFLGLCAGFAASWWLDIVPDQHWELLRQTPLLHLPRLCISAGTSTAASCCRR